jgi:hypothetical protein
MADHGFVGLALMLLLFFGCIVNCQTLSKRAKQLPELAWAVNLGGMLQLAMWTFLAGSMTLHTATQSPPYEFTALSLAARGIVERRLAQIPKKAINEAFLSTRAQPEAGLAAGPAGPAPAPAAGLRPVPAKGLGAVTGTGLAPVAPTGLAPVAPTGLAPAGLSPNGLAPAGLSPSGLSPVVASAPPGAPPSRPQIVSAFGRRSLQG